MTTKVSSGVAHKVLKDMRAAITSTSVILDAWNALTPLARNEWIYWTISCKKKETRDSHVTRMKEDLVKGKNVRVVGLDAHIEKRNYLK